MPVIAGGAVFSVNEIAGMNRKIQFKAAIAGLQRGKIYPHGPFVCLQSLAGIDENRV